jgi:ornithine carbamoyltransferase
MPAASKVPAPPADVLSILDVKDQIPRLLRRALELKAMRHRGTRYRPLEGKALAMIFEKPSTRTRSSFELAMSELGGHPVYLSPRDMQLGRGETIADTARVLSRYYHGIVYRAFRHADEEELAKWASVPVINALDDREHPCQILADLTTLHERFHGRFQGHRLAYIGDGNNVLVSLLLGSAAVGLDFVAAIPPKYRPDPSIVEQARSLARPKGSRVEIVTLPAEAARGSDVLYTDVWVSMGDEAQEAERKADFAQYRLDDALLDLARPGAFAMHDLPAHRGLEISDPVMDGERQAIWDQAENRLHAQKALLEWVLGTPRRRSR